MSEMVKVEVAGGGDYFDAYLATPSGTPKGGVVVIQEIFGVNADIKETANWLAGEGYLALAPDLFWRQERNVALTDGSEDEWQKAFALMNGYDGDEGLAICKPRSIICAPPDVPRSAQSVFALAAAWSISPLAAPMATPTLLITASA